jgi:hypothetical protein
MNPPTEQLIRDYLNRVSVAARGRLSADDRRAFLARTREYIEQNTRALGHTGTADVLRLLADLGDPAALVTRERERLAEQGSESAAVEPQEAHSLTARARRLRSAPANVASILRASAAAVAPGDAPVPEPADDNPLTGDITEQVRRPINARWKPGQVIQPKPQRPRRALRFRPGAPAAGGGQDAVRAPRPETRQFDTSQLDAAAAAEPQAPEAPPLPADNVPSSRPEWPARAARRPSADGPDQAAGPGQVAGPGPAAVNGQAPAAVDPSPPPAPGRPPVTRPPSVRPPSAVQPPATEPPGAAGEPAASLPAAAGEGDSARTGSTIEGRVVPQPSAAGGPDAGGPAAEPGEVPPRGARITWASGVRSAKTRLGGMRGGTGRPGGAARPGGAGRLAGAWAGRPRKGKRPDYGRPETPESAEPPVDAESQGLAGRLGAAAGSTATRTLRAAVAAARRHPLEATAVVLLGLGGVIYPPVWLMGAAIATVSKIWDIRDKWIGLGLPIIVVVVWSAIDATGGGSHLSLVDHLRKGWIFGDHLSRILAVLSACYLIWRVWRGRRPSPIPPWTKPRKAA